jgi:hypothetical protein
LRHPTAEQIWQRTRSQPNFDPRRLGAALAQNTRTSYGLTLVLGCPLPADVLENIESLKDRYGLIASNHIDFGRPEAYHLTVYGLKRSRATPYTRQELDPVLSGLDRVLHRELGSVSGIRVRLSGPVVADGGAVLVLGQPDANLVRLRAAIARLAGVDPLKSPSSHITIGQFTKPFGSARACRRAMEEVEALRDFPMGNLLVGELRLVYYRHRLLHDLAWQRTIRLPVDTRAASVGQER